MDNSDYSRNRGSNDYLGVNKIGKNIKKSPLHQPSFTNPNPARQPPQPQVYNINKNDFQSIVQQLTGSPSRQSQEPAPRPVQSAPRPPNMRLQRSRPSSLTPLNVSRPRMPIQHPRPQEVMQPNRLPNGGVPGGVGYNGSNLARPNLARPPHQGHQRAMGGPTGMGPPSASGDHAGWSNANIAESPISAYMRYLQNSIIDPTQGPPQPISQAHPAYQQNVPMQSQSQSQGQQQQSYPLAPQPPSPWMNGPPPLPSPRMNGGPPLPPLPSPRMNGPPPPLPSPTSQFPLPSPSGYLNLLSPRSPYPLLSPGYQHPPPLTPNFSFSPMTQPGAFGAGPQPPPSPGMGFPSPGFFSITSPRWRE